MLLTFGHGTAAEERITELLRNADVAVLVDIRTAPGSRRHPHVARAELERWLPEAGIAYRWEKRLGGFRKAPPDSPDVVWREDMFRGYAAHMRTGDFLAATDEVLAQASADTTAVMCSESLWWRCTGGCSPISSRPRVRCRSGISCTTEGWKITGSPPACGGGMTACSSTTQASR
jgi:uncharacterized protein (DUF488 family)